MPRSFPGYLSVSLSQGVKNLHVQQGLSRLMGFSEKALLVAEIQTSPTLVQAALGRLLCDKMSVDAATLLYIKTPCAHRLPWPQGN